MSVLSGIFLSRLRDGTKYEQEELSTETKNAVNFIAFSTFYFITFVITFHCYSLPKNPKQFVFYTQPGGYNYSEIGDRSQRGDLTS